MQQPRSERRFSTHSPDVLWDYIVIGSGMGGLTTAALLSKLGKRVLIVEQHYVPGGFTHTFKRKGWVWDVGVHAVGEVDSRAMVGQLLQVLTEDRLAWTSLGRVYDEFHFPDLRIDFPDNRRDFFDALVQAFPSEQDAINAYFNKVREVGAVMKRYYLSRVLPSGWGSLAEPLLARDAYRLLTQRTGDVLDAMTSNERLKTVLTAQWGYYGSPPKRSSFAMHGLVAKHFWHGGYYPVGGSAQIARSFMETVAGAGGWTRISAEVEGLLLDGRRAAGVRLKGGEVLRAKRVISAIGALPTVQRLLSTEQREARWVQDILALKPSPCHICLYLGFKGDIQAAGATPANQWFYETWASDVDAWDISREQDEAPVLYCSFPSLKDPQHQAGPEQLHTGEVVTFVPYEAFAPWKDERWKKRGEDYEALKARLTDRLLTQFFRHRPALKPLLAFAELSTPLSTEHFTRAANGAIYGIEPTPARFATRSLRPHTPIPGFYMSGSDMATVGVIGAMMGGVLSAVAAEPFSAMPWLRKILGQNPRR